MRRNRLMASLVLLAIIIVTAGIAKTHNSAPASPPSRQGSSLQGNDVEPTILFNKNRYSTTDPASLWIVVNKQRPLNPKNYVPSDLVVPAIPLRSEAGNSEMHVSQTMAPALEQLVSAALQEGIGLMLASGYRSYGLQVSVYANEVKNYGQTQADRESARPGYSEHQTGLAADLEPTNRVCEVQDCFANTAEGKWLATNAHRYGFILRYAKGKEQITGYRYEPWHIRYIGVELSAQTRSRGIETLEEFFGLPAAPNYQ